MAAQVIPIEPQHSDLENKALTWADQARSITVRSPATHAMACDTLTAVKALRNEAEAHHRPIIDSAHRTHKLACEALNKIDRPLAEAEAILKRGIGAYELEQRRIQEQRVRETREAAERLLAEQREAEIEAAEADGASAEEVKAMIEAPIVVPVAPVAPTFTPAAGVSTAKTYRAEVVDFNALIRAVHMGLASRGLLMANESALNQMARALKGAMVVPGVRVIEESVVRAKGR